VIHELKIEKNYLQNILDGKKYAEVRYNDRDYQVGDTLEFSDWRGKYSFIITHIHSGLGMADGYVILSIRKEYDPPMIKARGE
jgi:hypothetical protein